MSAVTHVSYTITGKLLDFQLLQSRDLPTVETVNIFASGPSVEQVVFAGDVLEKSSLFVNGSISLLGKYDFTNIVGYVISDARFIEHSLATIRDNYSGQPWFITLPVLQALIKKAPDMLLQYHTHIRLIYAVDRPIVVSQSWRSLLNKKSRFKLSKSELSQIESRDFVIDKTHTPVIGVSLDIEKGFVEAGTVAYVAAQIAFAMQAKHIHLFGIDLINSDQPRFYETNDNKAPCKLDKAISERIIPSFDLLAREYRERSCEVFNHSPISQDLFCFISHI